MDTPKQLYHYTTINTLALILANKTIRFSALNTVNDTTEGKSDDIGDLGMYLFVSCWTVVNDEHLPLWNMYTPNMRGVRIKIPFPIFPTYEFHNLQSLFPEDDLITESNMILPNLEPIREVIYTDDPDLLNPKTIVKMSSILEGINLHPIGRYKSKLWLFENEWRFFFAIVPKPRTTNIHDLYSIDRQTELIDKREPLGFNFYDLRLREESFAKMEITLGPKCEPGDKEIIESLIELYNPTATFGMSKLTGKIR